MRLFLTMFMDGPLLGLPVVESGWRRWLGDASAASNFCTGTGSGVAWCQ